MLATKLRALLQRNKGRDLFDLAQGLAVFGALDTERVVDLLGRYLAGAEQTISRAVAEARTRPRNDRNPVQSTTSGTQS